MRSSQNITTPGIDNHSDDKEYMLFNRFSIRPFNEGSYQEQVVVWVKVSIEWVVRKVLFEFRSYEMGKIAKTIFLTERFPNYH